MGPAALLLISISAAALALGACGSPRVPAAPVDGATRSLRGTVTGLEPRYEAATIRERPRAVTVRADRGGLEQAFRLGQAVNTQVWNLLHLNSHLLTGEPLEVLYQETPDGPVAIELRE